MVNSLSISWDSRGHEWVLFFVYLREIGKVLWHVNDFEWNTHTWCGRAKTASQNLHLPIASKTGQKLQWGIFRQHANYPIKWANNTLHSKKQLPDWTGEARYAKWGSPPHKWDTRAGEEPTARATTPGWPLWTLYRGGESLWPFLYSSPTVCFVYVATSFWDIISGPDKNKPKLNI